MTLGCGGYGGNITSDNISPKHLLNIKRLAYETTPVATLRPAGATGRRGCGAAEGAGRTESACRHRCGVAGAEDRRVPCLARVHSSGFPGPTAIGSCASGKV